MYVCMYVCITARRATITLIWGACIYVLFEHINLINSFDICNIFYVEPTVGIDIHYFSINIFKFSNELNICTVILF